MRSPLSVTTPRDCFCGVDGDSTASSPTFLRHLVAAGGEQLLPFRRRRVASASGEDSIVKALEHIDHLASPQGR